MRVSVTCPSQRLRMVGENKGNNNTNFVHYALRSSGTFRVCIGGLSFPPPTAGLSLRSSCNVLLDPREISGPVDALFRFH